MRAEVEGLARERCRALGIDRLETDSYKRLRTGRAVKGTKESWAQCGNVPRDGPRDGQY